MGMLRIWDNDGMGIGIWDEDAIRRHEDTKTRRHDEDTMAYTRTIHETSTTRLDHRYITRHRNHEKRYSEDAGGVRVREQEVIEPRVWRSSRKAQGRQHDKEHAALKSWVRHNTIITSSTRQRTASDNLCISYQYVEE
jgi:hypothetical protein